MSPIKNFLQSISTGAKVLIASGIILFFTILIISIINLTSSNQPAPEYLNITNLSDSLSELDLPDQYKTGIQQYVWAQIKNLPGVSQVNQSDQISQVDAVIREGSLKENGSDNYSVVVDIEPLHYSFHVSFFWNPDLAGQPYVEPGYYLECPYPDEVIYPDTPCLIGTPIDQISRYLPVSIETELTTISASIQATSTGRSIVVKINACGDEKILSEGNLIFRNWVKDHYLDPNDFDINLLNTCTN